MPEVILDSDGDFSESLVINVVCSSTLLFSVLVTGLSFSGTRLVLHTFRGEVVWT